MKSNVAFIEFFNKRSNEMRLCGRAINDCAGWEKYNQTILINASYNYIKEINPRLSDLKNLTDINFSHNDISAIPYSVGQLQVCRK